MPGQGEPVARQGLLIPEVVELPEDEATMLIARANDLEEVGLVVESFGPGAVAVTETPALLGEVDAAAMVRDIAADLAEWDEPVPASPKNSTGSPPRWRATALFVRDAASTPKK